MYRSIFEGIAYGTNHVFDVFKELNNLPENLFSVGGGTKIKYGLKQHLILLD